jgi:5'-3' exonuclease
VKRLLLIDGDQFLFKSTSAIEKDVRWDDFNHVLFSNANEAWDTFVGMLKRIFERFETEEHALCFTTPPNFRRTLAADYKGNRQTRKPLCYSTLREKAEAHYTCVSLPGLEADDVMGILATKPGKTSRIIVSQDKDMKTVPSTVWDGVDLTTYSEAEADYWHLYQTLVGDSSDGYKGCPGIGPKKAEGILAHTILAEPSSIPERERGDSYAKTRWARVVETYAKAKLTEADALVQARLARILRWTDWDGETKTPILWTPK